MRPHSPLVAVLAIALLGGCVLRNSQPSRLYVLDAVAASENAAAAGTAPTSVVGIQRVTVPAWMDRTEILGRSAGGEISADGLAQWGEPLARGIQRVVVENMAALLPDRHLVAAPFATRQVTDHRVEITVAEAGRQADGSVLVEARWGIVGRDGATLVQRRSSHRATPAAGSAGTVKGVSAALADLSREIATTLRGLPPRVESAAPERQ